MRVNYCGSVVVGSILTYLLIGACGSRPDLAIHDAVGAPEVDAGHDTCMCPAIPTLHTVTVPCVAGDPYYPVQAGGTVPVWDHWARLALSMPAVQLSRVVATVNGAEKPLPGGNGTILNGYTLPNTVQVGVSDGNGVAVFCCTDEVSATWNANTPRIQCTESGITSVTFSYYQ